jgi:hypothetical protein
MLYSSAYNDFYDFLKNFILLESEIKKDKIIDPFSGNHYLIDSDKLDNLINTFKSNIERVTERNLSSMSKSDKKSILEIIELLKSTEKTKTVYSFEGKDQSWRSPNKKA